MKKLPLLTALLAAMAILASPALAARGAWAPLEKSLETTILRQLRANNVKGLSIALVSGQDVVWTRGFGFADEQAGVPARPDTIYRAGSISKVVTNMRVMQLAEAGRIVLDKDIRAYVPEFSVASRFAGTGPITPRQLMTHHSGLPTDVVAGMWSDAPVSLAQYIPTLARESLASPPGEQFRYSNVGFSLLGRAVEKIEGRDFAQCMRLGLLQPLGMQSSSYVMLPGLEARYAKGYRAGKEAQRFLLRDQPAGSLFTSVEDLATLLRAMFADGCGVIAPDSLRQMLTRQYPGLPLDFGMAMGLGWMLSGLTLSDGAPVVWHGGAASPHQALLAFVPGENVGVALLANADEAARFLAPVALEALEGLRAAKTGAAPKPAPTPPRPDPTALSPEDIALTTGNYATFGAQWGSVWLDKGRLHMWLADRTITLEPIGGGVFLPARDTLFGLVPRITPHMALERKTVLGRDVLLLTGQAMPIPFAKIPPQNIPEAWRKRLGAYVIKHQDPGLHYAWMELGLRDGVLVAGIGLFSGDAHAPPSAIAVPLLPVSDTEAVIAGIGTGTGAVVRATPTGLYHCGYDFIPAARAD